MNNSEVLEKLRAYLKCRRRQVKGIYEDCNNKKCDNCDLCYMQGTVGEHIEAIEVATQALEKLQVYENLEEQGRLLKLPCRLGDTVYILNQKRIIPLEICEIYFDSHGIEMAAKNREELGYRTINLSEDGISVEWYETEEEAKAAMNKLKGKDNKDIERD